MEREVQEQDRTARADGEMTLVEHLAENHRAGNGRQDDAIYRQPE